MKWIAVSLILIIAVGIVVPPSLTLVIADRGTEAIGLLDVCHKATPSLSSNGNMPCLSECPCSTMFLSCFFTQPIKLDLPEFLIPSRTDHPPRA